MPCLIGCDGVAQPVANAAQESDDDVALQKLVDRGGLIRLTKPEYRLTRPIVVDLAKTGFTCIEGGTVARVVMTGPGPAFKFVGTHRGSADSKTFDETVWTRERMPGVAGVEIVGAHAEADGIEAAGTMQLTLSRMLIRRCRHGVRLVDRNRNVTIADSHVYQNRGAGVFFDAVNLHQANVTGCHLSYNDGGGVVVVGGEVRNLQITGCDIESNQGKDHPPTANVLIDSTGGTNAEVAVTGCTLQHNHHAAGSANLRVKGLCGVKRKTTDELRDGNITITGNVISDTMTNIHLDHARGVVVTGNTFWTGYEHDLLVEHSAHVVIGPNSFERNPRYGGRNARDRQRVGVPRLRRLHARRPAHRRRPRRPGRVNAGTLRPLSCQRSDDSRLRTRGPVTERRHPLAHRRPVHPQRPTGSEIRGGAGRGGQR
ncbi:MAG: right-handed parallel beta-helix repeat-containing protein [Pirellulales bacterium]